MTTICSMRLCGRNMVALVTPNGTLWVCAHCDGIDIQRWLDQD